MDNVPADKVGGDLDVVPVRKLRAPSNPEFAVGTGATSELCVAAAMPEDIGAVVCRGARPDLAGGDALVHCHRELVIVPGTTQLFEEPGTLDEVALLAGQWFIRDLTSTQTRLDHAQR
jgi:putative phosphoribosyl transferase